MQGLLNGWKQISSYIGVSVKTAITYASRYGMPVRFLPSGSAVAFPEEIRAWIVAYDDAKKGQKKKNQGGF